MKTCSRCKVEKPLTEFYKDSRSKENLQSTCKKCQVEYVKYWRQHNKERKIESSKKWHQQNREKQNERSKKWYQENKERVYESVKKWKEENKERVKENSKRYQKHKRERDPLFKLACNLRTRTCIAFKKKRWNKNSKTKEMLGCDYQTAFNHIESRFKDGMTWDNLGEWHIDHIIPLASAETEKELIKLCHYTNLQPLWAEENISKGNKIIACRINL